MSSGSGSPSSASSRLDVSAELGGPRVEVSAVRTGSQLDNRGPASTSDDQSPVVRASISQARIDCGCCSVPRGAWMAPNSSYSPYDTYNTYSPYNPYNPYILCSPCASSSTYCHQAPIMSSAPQRPAVHLHMGPPVDGNRCAVHAGPRPQGHGSRETRIVTKDGFEVIEECVNDRCISRTTSRIPPSTDQE